MTRSAVATRPIGGDAIAWAGRALGRYELPPEEISAVLETDNPELVRRYMELHRERLEERLLDRLRALADLERFLIQAILAGREGQADIANSDSRADGDDDADREPP